ncbi:putative tetratricopeptide-like helical domain superfamily [Helianthus anomalus]
MAQGVSSPRVFECATYKMGMTTVLPREKNGFYTTDIRVTNALIDVYARCGSVHSALRVFELIPSDEKNLVSWTSIITVFAMHGMAKEAVDSFKRMEEVGMKPNRGRLEDAEKMALEVPKDMANDVIWRTLLGACRYYDNVEMGKRITSRIFEMERRYSGDYVLLSNIFSGVGDYVDSENVRRRMDQMDVCKLPGCSSI